MADPGCVLPLFLCLFIKKYQEWYSMMKIKPTYIFIGEIVQLR